jgi:hypothetical protein
VSAAGLVALAGCSDRGLASAPRTTPGTGTWAVVVVAAVAVAVVVAAHVVLPARSPRGAALAGWVLALQAGGLVVGGATVVGAAVRTSDLVTRRPPAEQAASLLSLSGLDGGERGFFNLIVAVTLVIGGLLVALLALAARFAVSGDPVERQVATTLLALEATAAAVCAVLVAIGFRHAAFVLPAIALPVLVAGAISASPRYNGGHG